MFWDGSLGAICLQLLARMETETYICLMPKMVSAYHNAVSQVDGSLGGQFKD